MKKYWKIKNKSERIRLRKYYKKIRRQHRLNKKKIRENLIDLNLKFETTDLEENKGKIVKHKEIEMKPMSEEEAIMQMELLGHEFFVYKDVKREAICILYRRKDGDYGLIETI